MSYLAGILKKMKDPKPYLIDLLNFICQRFPPYDYFHVRVSCPRHTSHPVSVLGILLLEDTEGALGTPFPSKIDEFSEKSQNYSD